MVTLSRVPNLLPPRPSQDDGTLAKANSLKLVLVVVVLVVVVVVVVVVE